MRAATPNEIDRYRKGNEQNGRKQHKGTKAISVHDGESIAGVFGSADGQVVYRPAAGDGGHLPLQRAHVQHELRRHVASRLSCPQSSRPTGV